MAIVKMIAHPWRMGYEGKAENRKTIGEFTSKM
jgi:hypothetical protein